MKEVGTRIKQLRKEKGLTQEQLAENLDITAGTIGKIEIGRTGISIDLLICMSYYSFSKYIQKTEECAIMKTVMR